MSRPALACRSTILVWRPQVPVKGTLVYRLANEKTLHRDAKALRADLSLRSTNTVYNMGRWRDHS